MPATVFVRQDGDAVVLEPARPKTWPEGFFESVHISDPACQRIGPYDLLMAGQALASGLTLVTNNVQEFYSERSGAVITGAKVGVQH